MAIWDIFKKGSEEKIQNEKKKESLHKEIEILIKISDELLNKLKTKLNVKDSTLKNRANRLSKQLQIVKMRVEEVHAYFKEINSSNIPFIIKELMYAQQAIDSEYIDEDTDFFVSIKTFSKIDKSNIILLRTNIKRFITDLPKFKF